MLKLKRILLIAPSEMTLTPASERAPALACATGAQTLNFLAGHADGHNSITIQLEHAALRKCAGKARASGMSSEVDSDSLRIGGEESWTQRIPGLVGAIDERKILVSP
ncbi:hypothetical protein D3C80_1886030 [compost metagenome]